jgi:hypothetical protein
MYNHCADGAARDMIPAMGNSADVRIAPAISSDISMPSLRYLRSKLAQVLGRDCGDAVLAAALDGCGLTLRLDAPLDPLTLVRVASWLSERGGLPGVVGMGVRIRCLTCAALAERAQASVPWQ